MAVIAQIIKIMAKVTGLGAAYSRADVAATKNWYTHLGVSLINDYGCVLARVYTAVQRNKPAVEPV
jgi:hypothetical protein